MKKQLIQNENDAIRYLTINIGASVYNINLPEKYPCLVILTEGHDNRAIYIYESDFNRK